MLVLSRRESGKIVFPTVGITVEVLRVQGNKTRIGIDAPREIPIHRHEVSDRSKPESATWRVPGDDFLVPMIWFDGCVSMPNH